MYLQKEKKVLSLIHPETNEVASDEEFGPLYLLLEFQYLFLLLRHSVLFLGLSIEWDTDPPSWPSNASLVLEAINRRGKAWCNTVEYLEGWNLNPWIIHLRLFNEYEESLSIIHNLYSRWNMTLLLWALSRVSKQAPVMPEGRAICATYLMPFSRKKSPKLKSSSYGDLHLTLQNRSNISIFPERNNLQQRSFIFDFILKTFWTRQWWQSVMIWILKLT